MFTNFSKPGNNAPETRRRCQTLRGNSAAASRLIAVAGCAALSRRCLPREIGKGRERRDSGRIYRSRAIDGTRVSAARLPQRVTGDGTDDGTVVVASCVTTTSHHITLPEIARREALSHALVSRPLSSRLRSAANKFARTKSSAHVP